MAKTKKQRQSLPIDPDPPVSTTEPKYVYTCTCGFRDPKPLVVGAHIGRMSRKEPGMHTSGGKINVETGEVVLPPVKDRTPEQKHEMQRKSASKLKADKKAARSVRLQNQAAIPIAKLPRTTNLSEASLFRFTPKMIEGVVTPIMIDAREAAIREWGWPADMDWTDFIDTWFYHSFKACGVTLHTYTVDPEAAKGWAKQGIISNNGDAEPKEGEGEEEQDAS